LKDGDLVELTEDGKLVYDKYDFIWPAKIDSIEHSIWGEPFIYLDNGATITERYALVSLENICEQEE
jgi:hypothetical protein